MQAPWRVGRILIGLVAILAGTVWIAQGQNLPMAPRSFMTSDRTWFVIGVVTAAAGVWLATRGWRRA
jgi:negative regulator of sigma E activity